MKVSEMIAKIEHLKDLRRAVHEVINIGDGKAFDNHVADTLEEAKDAISDYIDELMRKEVKV